MRQPQSPLVSVLLAVHDGMPFIGTTVEAVLRQTVGELELVVVDDASSDETAALVASVSDPRVQVLTNDAQQGLAASLNVGLDRVRGRYVARIDADDVPFPDWLARLLERIEAAPRVSVVGSAMLDIDEEGAPERLHRMPQGSAAVRWHSLFSAPFFHSTVLLERDALDRHALRYDPSRLESEDYDLWERLLAVAEGDNDPRPLVLHRLHPGQASSRRRELQESHQREVALRAIAALAPELPAPELAWRLATARPLDAAEKDRAVRSFVLLLREFERRHGVDAAVRGAAARALARAGRLPTGLRLAPATAFRSAVERARRPGGTRAAARRAERWLAELQAGPVTSVAVVSPEPTPYRAPLLDRLAARPELDLTVIYAAQTVAGRNWTVEPRHRAVFLRGVRIPGLRRVLRHDYPVTPAIARALRRARPDVVVVSGWSTFAAQAAIVWCRARDIPYVLLVESHDRGPRAGWRRIVKRAVVPRIIRGASGYLAVGTLAADSLVSRGARPDRVRIFANTVDVPEWERQADELRSGRDELRQAFGAGPDDVVVLSVGRLAPEKGLDVLVRAVAQTDDPRVLLVVAGAGPMSEQLVELAAGLGVRLLLTGELAGIELAGAYVAADVFALLSTHEPWGVVVNEAAASGVPLVLSDAVGAAHDLLVDGENGFLVPTGDAAAAAASLRRLAADPAERLHQGASSRERVRAWGYDPSVDNFLSAVRDARAVR